MINYIIYYNIKKRGEQMKKTDLLQKYIDFYHKQLLDNNRILTMLKNKSIYENYIFVTFSLAYSNGSIEKLVSDDPSATEKMNELGLLKNDRDIFASHLLIPVLDENKTIVNIAGFNLHPKSKTKLIFLNNAGVFNKSFLTNCEEIILTENPLETLILLQNDYANTTFLIGDDNKYLDFCKSVKVKKAIFTFKNRARLFYDLTKNGISTQRCLLDVDKIKNGNAKTYLEEIFSENKNQEKSSDIIAEIERGFLFQFPHLNYRIIGNFSEQTMNLKANIKVYKDNEVHVDTLDLYKNRER